MVAGFENIIIENLNTEMRKTLHLTHQDIKVPKAGHYYAEVRATLGSSKGTFVPPKNDKCAQVRHPL